MKGCPAQGWRWMSQTNSTVRCSVTHTTTQSYPIQSTYNTIRYLDGVIVTMSRVSKSRVSSVQGESDRSLRDRSTTHSHNTTLLIITTNTTPTTTTAVHCQCQLSKNHRKLPSHHPHHHQAFVKHRKGSKSVKETNLRPLQCDCDANTLSSAH